MKSGRKNQCYDEAKVEGKDSGQVRRYQHTWPRDKPNEQNV